MHSKTENRLMVELPRSQYFKVRTPLDELSLLICHDSLKEYERNKTRFWGYFFHSFAHSDVIFGCAEFRTGCCGGTKYRRKPRVLAPGHSTQVKRYVLIAGDGRNLSDHVEMQDQIYRQGRDMYWEQFWKTNKFPLDFAFKVWFLH